MRQLKIRLHPIWNPKNGFRYSVIFRGKLLVAGSRDPECEAARALCEMGLTGKLMILDGKTGKPRTIVDIEKAAQLRVEEGPYGPRFVKWHKTVVISARDAHERERDRGDGGSRRYGT